jgi:DNA polymerase III delta prime subunit
MQKIDITQYRGVHCVQPVDDAAAFVRDLQASAQGSGIKIIPFIGDKFTVDESIEYRNHVQGYMPNHQIISILAYDIYLTEGQQFLLKIMEESPSHITIVIVMPSGAVLLPTILSRSRILPVYLSKKAKKAGERKVSNGGLSPSLAKRFLFIQAAKGNLPKTWMVECEKWFKTK